MPTIDATSLEYTRVWGTITVGINDDLVVGGDGLTISDTPLVVGSSSPTSGVQICDPIDNDGNEFQYTRVQIPNV